MQSPEPTGYEEFSDPSEDYSASPPGDLGDFLEMMGLVSAMQRAMDPFVEQMADLQRCVQLLVSNQDVGPQAPLDPELVSRAVERCLAGELNTAVVLGVNVHLAPNGDEILWAAGRCPAVELRTLGIPGREALISYLVRVADPPGHVEPGCATSPTGR